MGVPPLSEDEVELWHAWKLAGEAVMSAVERDIAEGGGLSGPEFGILSRLVDLGDGELRQQDLAESMRWAKSRLSHQLTRMEGRGLTTRRPADAKGVIVGITAKGRKALAAARPIHAKAIRRHLLAKLTPGWRQELLVVCELLHQDEETSTSR